ncbi:glycosyltransferase family 4 protein [Pseudomonas arcuscaelestis]|jgi:rhamnosyl/mannosyltransferase|uniref:glycosyltransferase family 4 protein n=1 Tax=Pseudomonas arcuscaelestis TaxID=2710591 RepID=UPI00193EC07A|nr:glycosyltransferase family 4 protein [Pseudomonas arcuscaelestis]MBM3111560.1 glycosyltransferase family 4 protein [Pseudomonas arcuscaelestis]
MKVLQVYKTYYPDTFGGVEQVIFQLACGGERYGIDTTVLAVSKQREGGMQVANHRVDYVKPEFELLSTPFSLSCIKRFKSLAKEVDLVHYHYPWPFMDVAHFLVGHNKPTVLTYHSDIVKQKVALNLYRPLQRLFLDRIDRIVCTSDNYLNSSKVLSRYREKITVIPIGLARDSYPVATESTLQQWSSRFPGKFFLFVGVLRYYKGLHTLLEAAQGFDYPVLIVGSGPIENELKQKAQALGLSNIHFLGALPDLDKVALLSLCHATVFPSHLRSEAFGVSLLEAAMYSKPMICCEIATGTTYINSHKLTGLVVPPEAPEALRQAMRYLWNNPVEAQAMGLRAGERFESLFTAEQMTKHYAGLYTSLLQEKAK